MNFIGRLVDYVKKKMGMGVNLGEMAELWGRPLAESLGVKSFLLTIEELRPEFFPKKGNVALCSKMGKGICHIDVPYGD
ncbi:MAG: hypothetical protein JRJ38_19640 [Deltaproteobacteria bacterium]|nr:hypothetical protein [Deltaproteobacteria bacterium]